MSDERTDRTGLPAGIIAGVTFLLGLVVLVLLLRTGDEDPVPTAADLDFDFRGFEERVDERLDPVTVRPAGAFRIRVSTVRWHDAAGRPFLSAPSATFVLDLGAPGGSIRITSGTISRPEVRLVQGPGGRWNYEGPLAPLVNGNGREGARNGAGLAVRLANIVVTGGLLTVERPDTRFAASAIELRLASAALSGPGVTTPTFQLASAQAVLELPDTAGGTIARAVTVEDAGIRLVDGGAAFDIRRGTFGSSTFADATGIWSPALGGLGLDADLRAERFRLADLPWLRAEVPAEATGSFRVRIEPAGEDRTAVALTGLQLSAPGSAASGSLRAVFGGGRFSLESIDMRVDPLALSLVEAFTGPLPYTGSLRGTLQGTGGEIAFDLTASLATSLAASTFETQLTGEVSFTPAGLALDRVTATLDGVPLSALEPIAPGLPLAGPVSGTVTLTGMPSEEPIRLDVRLEAGGGIVSLAGLLDLTGAVPAYDLNGRLMGVELRAVFEPAMPPAQVHATFELRGSGTDLRTADARLRLDGTFTGWRSEPDDTVAVLATLAGGRLDVSSGRLELGPVSLAATGTWALVGGGGGAIRYELQVASLEPLAPYLPTDAAGRARFTHGSLRARGQLSGTLDAPALTGALQARDFRYGEWAAERLEGDYAVRLGEDALPLVEAQLAGTQIRTPSGDFTTLSADIDFTRPAFDVAIRGEQLDGGAVELQASGLIYETGGREVDLRTVELDLADQRWRLPSPARITWTAGEAVRVEDLRLERADGEGVLRIDGIVAPFDEADFALEVRQLPIGELLGVVGIDYEIAGVVDAAGTVRGPSDAPFIDLDVSLAEGTIRDVSVRSITAEVRYEGDDLLVDGAGILGDSAWVELTARLPARIALGLPPSVELIEGRELEARLVTEDFPLATLDPGIRSVQDLEGLVRADVRIGGTPGEPRLSGDVELVDGEVTVPMLDKRYTGIDGLATLSGRELRVQRMVAHSGGTATVGGTITFGDLTNPVFDLTATLDGFEPQGVSNAGDAAARGTLRLTGSLADPLLSGRVQMDNGTVSLVPFTGGPTLGDRMVGVAESFAPLTQDEFELDGVGDPFIRVANLEVVAGEDLWFATEGARVQLRGTLDVETVGRDIALQGTLTGNRGTFDLRAGPIRRRFSVIDASIRFLGSPGPNPALDITASRQVPTLEGGMIDVRVRVTGNLDNPQLALASAEGVSVPESELLSLIVFGRQSYTGGDVPVFGQQGFFGDALALTGIYDIASAELAQWDFIEQLDFFQIQMRSATGFDVDNLWLVAGEQVDIGPENVLVTLETPLLNSELIVLGAEWRIDRQWTLELSFEPVSYLGATGIGNIPVSLDELDLNQRQWLLVIRRRWTY